MYLRHFARFLTDKQRSFTLYIVTDSVFGDFDRSHASDEPKMLNESFRFQTNVVGNCLPVYRNCCYVIYKLNF